MAIVRTAKEQRQPNRCQAANCGFGGDANYIRNATHHEVCFATV